MAETTDGPNPSPITGIEKTPAGYTITYLTETHDFGGHEPSDDPKPDRIKLDRTVPVFVREGYDSLFTTLIKALTQAQDGKGKERHAQPDTPFEQQPIIQIGRMVGMGFQNGQAIKKMVEAQGMVKRQEYAAAEREVLGAINYLAAVAIEIRKQADEHAG